MKWSLIKTHLKSIWLLAAKKSLHEVTITGMLTRSFARHWDDYPWKVTETLRFTCLSALGDLYLVEKILCKRYLLPDGQVKTEVEDCKEWKAVFNSSTCVLMEIEDQMRLIAFIPEKMKLLYSRHEYSLNK